MTDPVWRERKMRELCAERHPILERHFSGTPHRTDASVLKHIHRELDFYEMQMARPGFDAMRARNRKLRVLARRMQRLVDLAKSASEPSNDSSGSAPVETE